MYADAPSKVFPKCKKDLANNQVVSNFAALGIRITFVPFDTVKKPATDLRLVRRSQLCSPSCMAIKRRDGWSSPNGPGRSASI
ncbi:hypothetical protein ElyMa_006466200 [Elysia marginata]|uniref:Uncharacterized protein n=1 Tax=Elysia marginata TaxID=1093978 RepID=A0AAV4I076_9GAST|nr:hypothetical protein ElyMa_006466200 [Elysia marginata]